MGRGPGCRPKRTEEQPFPYRGGRSRLPCRRVRERRKDGAEGEESAPTVRAVPPRPVIRDPVLARAGDLIKALAIVRQSHA